MTKFKLSTLALVVGTLLGSTLVLKLTPQRQTEEVFEVPTVKSIKEPSLPPTLEKVKVKRINAAPDQVLFFNVPVTFESVTITLAFLEQVANEGVHDTVYIVLDSPGGSVIDGANLISYMKSSKLKIKTLCWGLCASMAAQIHQAGTERLMTEKAILMFHPASSRAGGTIEEMLNQLTTIKKYVDRLDAEVAARAGIPYEVFKQMVVSELWVEAVDAKEIGLTDNLAYIYLKESSNSEFGLDLKKKMKHDKVNNVKGVRDIK